MVSQHGVSKLVIFGGKVHGGAVLGDVWSIETQPQGSAAPPVWEQLWDSGVSEGPAPPPRKGHVAVAVPGPEPSLVGCPAESAGHVLQTREWLVVAATTVRASSLHSCSRAT